VGLVPGARRDGGGLDRADFTAAAMLQKIAWVREAAGDRLDSLELHTLIQAVVVTSDRQAAADQLATRFGGIARDVVLESPYVLLGTAAEICETLRQRRDQYGISYITVFDRDAEAFAPIVASLTST
jgi:hypothetical protein